MLFITIGSELRVPVCVHSVLDWTRICGNQPQNRFKIEIGVQWCCNYELIMELASSTQRSSMRKMTIINDHIVRICPSDLIGWDNRGKNGFDWVKHSSENQYQASIRWEYPKRTRSTSFRWMLFATYDIIMIFLEEWRRAKRIHVDGTLILACLYILFFSNPPQ